MSSLFPLAISPLALPLAQNQQDAVLKAIGDHTRAETPGWMIGVLFSAALLGILVLLIAQRHRRQRPPEPLRRVLNNPKKLVKEVAESLQLSPAELRKLEHHAAKAGVENPLTLLLCPSLARREAEE